MKRTGARGRRGWRRWVVLLASACALGLLVEACLRSFWSRSAWIKAVPAGREEQVVLAGSAARGTVLDGHGDWFNEGKLTEIIIASKKSGDAWDRPSDIVIRNGRLKGSIRVMGMGRNGQGEEVRKSSCSEGHTGRAQAAAPTRILISNVEVVAAGRIPIYLAPGVTEVTIENCRFTGRSSSVVIYLDAESGRNVIRSNTVDVVTGREIVAVDGSAGNRIEGNRFDRMPLGGIYLYRNCGEGGTVRHQTPHGNVIAGNHFSTRWLGLRSRAIWLGSRNGRRAYCGLDAGYPFGSSADDRDFADDNLVTANLFVPPSPRAIQDDGAGNRLLP